MYESNNTTTEADPITSAFPSRELASSTEWLTFVLFGHSAFQYLYAGCELGLFELLNEQPGLSSEEIRVRLALQAPPVRGLLFGLSSLGLIEAADGGYRNGPAVERMLQSEDWTTFKDTVRLEGEIVYLGQTDFVESLRTNSNVGLRRIPGNGRDLYHRLAESPQMKKTFYDYMGSWSRMAIPKLIEAVDLSQCRRVLDVGGGDATNAIALARAFPHLRITVMELAANSEQARNRIEAAGLGSRIDVLEQDMFSGPFPQGYDCIIFIHQLVIWSKRKNRELLARAHQALPRGGQVVVFSSIADDSETSPVMAAMDSAYFLSLPVPEGLIYPYKDYEQWLREAGYDRIQRHQCKGWSPHGAVIGRKD